MAVKIRRDSQQWILDYLSMVEGKDRNFAGIDHTLWPPHVVRSVAMVPKVMRKIGDERVRLAEAAEKRGHGSTAGRVYRLACDAYRTAQHAIMENTPEKIDLYRRLTECYDRVIQYADYPIERVDIPWEGNEIPALFHILPDRRKAPCVLFIPGMDMTKEQSPDPTDNMFHERGMHVMVMDGPGQGESNVRAIHATHDNYERAATAVIDWLVTRPEVDPERIMVLGNSMGSYWAPRVAAHDKRVKACVAAMGCFGDKRDMFEKASPHFKQMWMYMSGIEDEDEFDKMAEKMVLTGIAGQIECPTLLVTGEFDQLSPLEQAYQVLDELKVPKELWVMADEAHRLTAVSGLAGLSFYPWALDWLTEVLDGKLPPKEGRHVYVERGSGGPW